MGDCRVLIGVQSHYVYYTIVISAYWTQLEFQIWREVRLNILLPATCYCHQPQLVWAGLLDARNSKAFSSREGGFGCALLYRGLTVDLQEYGSEG